MSADQFDQNAIERIISDADDKPVFVAANIKDNPVVTHKIDVGSEGSLYILAEA
jgi:hypothetical protein